MTTYLFSLYLLSGVPSFFIFLLALYLLSGVPSFFNFFEDEDCLVEEFFCLEWCFFCVSFF